MKTNGFNRYLSMVGKVPLCNKKKERAPHIFGFCFPLCYRCTGILIGAVFALITHLAGIIPDNLTVCLLCVILMFPLIIDGIRQSYFNQLSNNPIRMITGIAFGFSLSKIIFFLYISIF